VVDTRLPPADYVSFTPGLPAHQVIAALIVF